MAEWKKVVVSGSAISQLDNDSGYVTSNTQLSTEQVQDIVGAMFTGNTETRAAATYQDGDGTIDIVVDDMTANTMGSGFTVSATTDTTATTITQGDDLFFAAGTGITCETTADGTVTIANTVTDTNLSTEEVQDIVGAMFSSNTETRISATYQDGDGTIDLVVNDMTANTMGSGFTVSATTDTTATTITQGDDLFFAAGAGITCETTADGTVTIASTITDTNLSTEEVQDIVGAMFSSNTETRISATYQDGDGTIDLVVDDMTANTDVDVSVDNLEARLPQINTATTIGNGVTMTAGGDFVVTGDLTVSGTTTTVDTTNLNVTDQWINLNDGGGAADGGFVVEGAAVSFGWDNSAGRWGYLSTGAAEGQTAPTNDAFASQVVVNDTVAAYRKNGNIQINSGDIYIYVE